VPVRGASRNPPWWVTVVVIVGSLGVLSLSYGALIAPKTLLAPGQHMNDAARVWARYAAAYATSLGLALLALAALRARQALAGVLVQAALAELLLAAVGAVDRRWEQLAADVILLAAFLWCASRLLGRPPWSLKAWQDRAGP